jgi:hypothetical protein
MKFLLILALCGWTSFGQTSKAKPDFKRDKKIDPVKLIEEMLDRVPEDKTELIGTLKIRDGNGKSRRIPIQWITSVTKDDWNDIYRTHPLNGRIPPEQLTVIHKAGMTNQYKYRRDGEPVSEIATNLFIPFATSDFWVADFGMEFLRWPNPKHLENEMRGSRACHVIETRNPNPLPGAYSRVVSWIDIDTKGLYIAEAYDSKDKLLKEFSVRAVKNGRIKALEIRNDQTDSKTILEFEFEVPIKKESDSP